MDLIEKLANLAKRYEELNTLMAQPDVLEDIQLLQRYGREHAELEEVVQKYNELVETDRQLAEAREMYEGDEPEMRELAFEEMEHLKARKEHLLDEIKISLLPKDIMDEKNAIVTIQAGAGGDEAALFAGELFRMYSRYADNRRWKIEILDINETGQGGIKDITFVVKGKGAYSRLKYEGGTHRALDARGHHRGHPRRNHPGTRHGVDRVAPAARRADHAGRAMSFALPDMVVRV